MKLDDIKKLHQKKFRSQFEHYLLEGEHLVLELYKAAQQYEYLRSSIIYITDQYQAKASALVNNMLANTSFKTIVVSDKKMQQISDTKTPQGIMACAPMPSGTTLATSNKSNHSQRFVYLHEVQDPGNLGTILRSLAWFGNFQLLLSPNSVDPFNSKVVRSSMGAIFHVPVELDVSIDDLKARFNKFAYLDMQGEPIDTKQFASYECYLFGNEARGVPRDTLTAFNADPFTIKGSGNIDSLNLASAVNICLYQLSS